jgi:hypothetical protein
VTSLFVPSYMMPHRQKAHIITSHKNDNIVNRKTVRCDVPVCNYLSNTSWRGMGCGETAPAFINPLFFYMKAFYDSTAKGTDLTESTPDPLVRVRYRRIPYNCDPSQIITIVNSRRMRWITRGSHMGYWWESQKKIDILEAQEVGGWIIITL